MAIMLNREDDKNVELSRRISADLREKMEASAKNEAGANDPDFAEGAEYVKDLNRTSKFAWVWIVVAVVTVGALVALWINR